MAGAYRRGSDRRVDRETRRQENFCGVREQRDNTGYTAKTGRYYLRCINTDAHCQIRVLDVLRLPASLSPICPNLHSTIPHGTVHPGLTARSPIDVHVIKARRSRPYQVIQPVS